VGGESLELCKYGPKVRLGSAGSFVLLSWVRFLAGNTRKNISWCNNYVICFISYLLIVEALFPEKSKIPYLQFFYQMTKKNH
jgi:hypothetical protein